MANVDRVDNRAPEGTYQLINSIADLQYSRLGNAYTTRVLKVMHTPRVWPVLQEQVKGLPDGTLVAYLRRTPKRGDETNYFFTIAPDETVTSLRASEGTLLSDGEKLTDPPTTATLMREIRTAQRIQPTLKR